MPGAIGWAPALLPSRGGVIARPRFDPELLILRFCALRLRDRGSRKPLCYPSPQLCAPASSIACQVQVLPPFQFLAIRVELLGSLGGDEAAWSGAAHGLGDGLRIAEVVLAALRNGLDILGRHQSRRRGQGPSACGSGDGRRRRPPCPIRQGGMLASRASSCPRDSFWRSTMAPLLSRPMRWEDGSRRCRCQRHGDGIFGLSERHGGLLCSGHPLRRGILPGAPPVHPISSPGFGAPLRCTRLSAARRARLAPLLVASRRSLRRRRRARKPISAPDGLGDEDVLVRRTRLERPLVGTLDQELGARGEDAQRKGGRKADSCPRTL